MSKFIIKISNAQIDVQIFLHSLFFFRERTHLYRPSQGQKYFLKVVKNTLNFYRV